LTTTCLSSGGPGDDIIGGHLTPGLPDGLDIIHGDDGHDVLIGTTPRTYIGTLSLSWMSLFGVIIRSLVNHSVSMYPWPTSDMWQKYSAGKNDAINYGAIRIIALFDTDTFYGDDTISGGKGGDRLYGGNGNDSLFGGEGSDELIGGGGDDRLDGGDGDDLMIGDWAHTYRTRSIDDLLEVVCRHRISYHMHVDEDTLQVNFI
jgi:Ca2+-binding RTX toxin-like protein